MRLIVIGLMFVCAAAAAADTPENLVRKLGHPSFAEREAAEAKLLEMGTAALPAVRDAMANAADAETRERAMNLHERLARASDTGRLQSAKAVRLDYRNTPLSSALADFKQKTNIQVMLVPGRVSDANRPVTLAAGDYLPWEGLEALLAAAGLREDHRDELPMPDAPAENPRRYSRYYGETMPALYTATNAPILLVDGVAEPLPAIRSGAVRVTALPPHFAANRVVRGAGRVIIHLDVAAPSTTGWNGGRAVRIDYAEDDEGRPVFADFKLPSDGTSQYEAFGGPMFGRRVFWGGGMAWIDDGMSGASPNANPRLVAVSLRTNDRAIRKLNRFEGAIIGDIHTPNVPVLTITDLSSAIGVSHSGPQHSTFQVQEFRKNTNGTHTLKIRHEAPTQWALNNMRGMGFGGMVAFHNENPGEILNRIRFYDADGIELKKPAQESTSYSGDGFRQTMEATFRFPKSTNTPVKLVLTGTRVNPVEVPFKLVNVPMP